MVLVAGLAVLLTFGPDTFPLLAMRAFLAPWACLFLVVALFFLWRRCFGPAATALVAALLVITSILRLWPGPTAQGPVQVCLTVAQMNVHEDNDDHGAVVAAALRTGAGLIAFQEVDDAWFASLEAGLSGRYPWHVYGQGGKNHGIALFSRIPMQEGRAFPLEGVPATRSIVGQGECRLVLYTVHLRAPESWGTTGQRNRQWEHLATMVAAEPGRVCVMGDVNTVPWDRAFQGFVDKTGLIPAGAGLKPTWPAFQGYAVIPLDHVLVSEGIQLELERTFEIPGSDHLGLLVNVGIPGGSHGSRGNGHVSGAGR